MVDLSSCNFCILLNLTLSNLHSEVLVLFILSYLFISVNAKSHSRINQSFYFGLSLMMVIVSKIPVIKDNIISVTTSAITFPSLSTSLLSIYLIWPKRNRLVYSFMRMHNPDRGISLSCRIFSFPSLETNGFLYGFS